MSRNIVSNLLLYEQVQEEAVRTARLGYVTCLVVDPFARSIQSVRVRVALDVGSTVLSFEEDPGLLLGTKGSCEMQQVASLPGAGKVISYSEKAQEGSIADDSVTPGWRFVHCKPDILFSGRALVFIEKVSRRVAKACPQLTSRRPVICRRWS